MSVGERQLISIGRALLSHSNIVLLDEATAGIDPETDKNIQALIKGMFVGSTMIVVAHRLQTIMDSDTIIVLDRGTIVEVNSPQVLLKEQSYFRDMLHSFNN